MNNMDYLRANRLFMQFKKMCPQRREPNDIIAQELLKKKDPTKQRQNSQGEQNFQVLTNEQF